MPSPISPSTARYIKLGAGNRWFDSCRQNQRIELGHPAISHELALGGQWDEIAGHYAREHGYSKTKARDFIRELKDFYTLGPDCLWITFADGCLWWAFSEPEVTWLGGDGQSHGPRARPTIGPWRNTDIEGHLLRQADLSTRLTQVAAYRQTLCTVKHQAYLVRKINAEIEPIVAKARDAESTLVGVTTEMISGLHWRDFELLVDLIFAHSGWRRISEVGGALKDIDLALEQPVTGERAFVQVKSKADNSVLADYIDRFDKDPAYDRMFFVCHSPVGSLQAPESDAVRIWSGPRLAEMAVKAGLFDWILGRLA